MSKKNKFSGRDVNDKLMKSAGFFRDSLDDPVFNACGRVVKIEHIPSPYDRLEFIF